MGNRTASALVHESSWKPLLEGVLTGLMAKNHTPVHCEWEDGVVCEPHLTVA